MNTALIFSSAFFSKKTEFIKSPWRPASVVRRRPSSSVVGVKVHLFLNRCSNQLEIWWKHVLCDTKKWIFFFFFFLDFSIFDGTFSNFLTLENRGIFFQNATPLTILLWPIPIFFYNNLRGSLTKLVAQNFEFWLYWFFKKSLNVF